MAIERTYHCEGPGCKGHAVTATPPPHLPHYFMEVRRDLGNTQDTWHFCSWDCAMKYGASLPPMTVIAWDDVPPLGEEV